MPDDAEFTVRPFTLLVCAGCSTVPGQPSPPAVSAALKPTIRRCRHGMLVSVRCLLGPALCATRPTDGVVAALQPCTTDRVPTSPASLIGPVRGAADSTRLRDWIRSGRWDAAPLPYLFHHSN